MSFVTFPLLERCGRLGNQLWQIASTVGIARRLGLEPLFPPSWSYRRFFSLPDQMFGDEPGVPAHELVTHMAANEAQYLQDLGLFADVEDEIRSLFAPSEEAAAQIPLIVCPDDVAVHVRRTDNVWQQEYFWLATPEYFRDALALFPDRMVAIFSDDPEWCEAELQPTLGRESFVVHGTPRAKDNLPEYWSAPVRDWVDLFLMARCGAFVTVNSTFGWWGAWLSGSTEVAYPSRWYGPAYGHIPAHLMMPTTWRRVECS